jgi:outer membrane protein assembly factor BamE (lipoprotein component of BamABCDE complex)
MTMKPYARPSRQWARHCAAALLLLCLSACATTFAPTPYWEIRQAAFGELKAGVSTREDARRLIGVPILESQFPRQREEVWEYRYLEGAALHMLAHTYFDANGVYKYTAHMLDPAYTGRSSD